MFFEDEAEQRNHDRSKIPKFGYFDSKLFNFSSLFLIKLFKNLSGKTKAGILLSEPFFIFGHANVNNNNELTN
jgi:hypothetical protein